MFHTYSQSDYLSILSQSSAEPLKALAEQIIPALEPITVVYNRTGLVMLPFTDTAQGALFHLGEVLIAEARVQAAGIEGYGACLGHDLEQSLAIALLDAALTAGIETNQIHIFVSEQQQAQQAAEQELLKIVETTRAEMETF